MRILLLPALLILSLTGCVKETTWNYNQNTTRQVVVDALLTDFPGKQAVKIFYSVAALNEIPEPVTGANVIINTGDSSFILSEDTTRPGIYLTRSNFAVSPGITYTLQIFTNDQVYSAKASMEPGLEFDPLIYTKDDGSSLFRIDFVASAFEPADPAMWEVGLDWSKVPGYNPADSVKNRARLIFYTLPSIDVTEIFAPETEKITFPAGTIITQKRYSLTPGHAEFVRQLLSETNWLGGMFSTMPANVSTNLSNGATGYFATCGVRTLSFTVSP